MKRILLVGCGELGSRFLQAALQVKNVTQIEVVEPSAQSAQVGKARMDQIKFDSESIKVNWHQSLSSVSAGADLCIIATQADGREKIFYDVFKLGIKNILAEKIVTQSLESYNDVLRKAQELDINVWVNCKTRAYPIWKYIKGYINSTEELIYQSIGGNHGLCTNGLHTLDLFAFISDSNQLIDHSSDIDQLLHKTKRNKFDLSGTFQLAGSNKSKCIIHYSDTSSSSVLEIVSTPQYRWVLDHSTKQAFESGQHNKWTLQPIPFEGDFSVSYMSIKFISDILEKNTCELPTLQEAWAAHEYLFLVTLPVFNTLMDKNDNICPCT